MVWKFRRCFTAVALTVLAALVLAVPATAAPLASLEAHLTGEKEVPGPGDPDGVGHAVVQVFYKKVCYTLKVERIKPATAAHIHEGFFDEAGPVRVELAPPTDGSSSGCVAITRALSAELREHPRRYYVNVHNEPFPGGALRGQLHYPTGP